MDEITKLLHAPVFWVCTGIGSVLFNVISHYVIRVFDKVATLVGLGSSRFMRRRRLRFMKRVARLNRFVRRHPYGVQLYLHRSDSAKFTALGARIIAAVLGVASVGWHMESPHSNWPAMAGWLANLYAIGGMAYANKGYQLERLFRKSRYFYRTAPYGV